MASGKERSAIGVRSRGTQDLAYWGHAPESKVPLWKQFLKVIWKNDVLA